MAIDFPTVVYAPQYTTFSRPVTFYPIKSQPLVSNYSSRGIFDTVAIDLVGLDGGVVAEHRTILDILESDFTVLPIQGDQVAIPAHLSFPDQGTFEIIDAATNGGGETTLTLRKIMTATP